VPNERDQTVFLVEDEFDAGRCFRETESAYSDLETTIKDLISGQYNAPVRIASFNTAEGWSQDASGDIAREIQRRFDLLYEDVPGHLADFIEGQIGSSRQLALRLV
jgi:hypothetical protein